MFMLNLKPCKAGYYCPLGTAAGGDIKCLSGTFSNVTSLYQASQCFTCPGGSYCVGGRTIVSGSCSPGYYCPAGSQLPTAHACPEGTYSSATGLFDVRQCNPCTSGSYCLLASTIPAPCPSGKYSPNGLNASSLCVNCPAGFFCIAGSVVPVQCGVGKYSKSSVSACTICPLGHYCGSNYTTDYSLIHNGGTWASSKTDLSGVCFNGTYCGYGMTLAPTLTA